MSEFEKLLAEFMESEQYKDDSFHWPEMARAFYDKGVTAGQAASAARIAELEADCKVMAKIVINNHEDTCMECPAIGCKKGLNIGKPFIRDCCICPACTIAAKYREGKEHEK